MSDAELRALEQAWRASGSAEDERAYLHALRRAGRLDPNAVEVAAYLGDEVAESLLEGGLAAPAPKTGVAQFLDQLPGDGAVQFRAWVTALRHVVDQGGQAGLSLQAAACLEAAEQCDLEGAGASELVAARTAAEAHEAVLAQSPDFIPGLPLIAHAYPFFDGHEDGLELACWALARYAGGLEQDDELALILGNLLRGMTSGRAAERALRETVKTALLPWVLLRPSSPGLSRRPAPLGINEALLNGLPMSKPEAKAVVAAASPSAKRPTVEQARAVVEAFFLARGFHELRGSLVDAGKTRKVKLMKRGLQLLEGGPGKWKKLAGTQGRELLLTDAAEHLIRLARVTLSEQLEG